MTNFRAEANHFQLRASAFQMEHVFEGVGELLAAMSSEKGFVESPLCFVYSGFLFIYI